MSSFFSHAKINLSLQILNKREDGYHNLHSLFVEIDLADELVFSPADEFLLTVEGSDIDEIPLDDTNLICKAYRQIKKKFKLVPIEYSVHLKKQIPIGGGLGGGIGGRGRPRKKKEIGIEDPDAEEDKDKAEEEASGSICAAGARFISKRGLRTLSNAGSGP